MILCNKKTHIFIFRVTLHYTNFCILFLFYFMCKGKLTQVPKMSQSVNIFQLKQ